ncbi:MAG: hypothetical protein VBE63_21455 [Lamprobacter sp.]|nr:hypothetical protein [Lamprobacter sp.]MEA3642488.1 hypothetical protein [Lamprobacter sp.]
MAKAARIWQIGNGGNGIPNCFLYPALRIFGLFKPNCQQQSFDIRHRLCGLVGTSYRPSLPAGEFLSDALDPQPIKTVKQPLTILFGGPSASMSVSPTRQAGRLLIMTLVLPLITTPGP